MRNTAKNSGFHNKLGESGVLARRETALLPDGTYLFEDELAVAGEVTAKVITCAAWLLELYDLSSGDLFFIRGGSQVRPQSKRFAVFYPPFTIAQPCFKNVRGRLLGVAATENLPAELPTTPTLFVATVLESPSGVAQAIEILRSGAARQAVDRYPKVSLLSLKAKRLIDENYLVYPSIARIAARLGVTHAHLSRQFKLDFGMTPSQYFRLLRVADVALRLARGEEIIAVSQDVGYNDLSRFYKQFRQTTKTSPGACKTIMRPTRTE